MEELLLPILLGVVFLVYVFTCRRYPIVSWIFGIGLIFVYDLFPEGLSTFEILLYYLLCYLIVIYLLVPKVFKKEPYSFKEPFSDETPYWGEPSDEQEPNKRQPTPTSFPLEPETEEERVLREQNEREEQERIEEEYTKRELERLKREKELEEERKKKEFWFELDGFETERELNKVFEKLGYKTKLTPLSNDEGLDHILDGEIVVQTKNTKRKTPRTDLQRFRGSMKDYKKGIFVSINGFSNTCEEYVLTNDRQILLYDVNDVIGMSEGKKPEWNE